MTVASQHNYWRYFTDGRTGERVLGQMQGNGGVAVGLLTIRREQELLRSGERWQARFFEPLDGHVRIYRPERSDLDHDDPAGWVDMPLETLRVECRGCVEMRSASESEMDLP